MRSALKHLLRCHVTERVAGDTALEGCLQRTVPTTVCTSPFLKSTGWLSLTAELQCSSSTPTQVAPCFCTLFPSRGMKCFACTPALLNTRPFRFAHQGHCN